MTHLSSSLFSLLLRFTHSHNYAITVQHFYFTLDLTYFLLLASLAHTPSHTGTFNSSRAHAHFLSVDLSTLSVSRERCSLTLLGVCLVAEDVRFAWWFFVFFFLFVVLLACVGVGACLCRVSLCALRCARVPRTTNILRGWGFLKHCCFVSQAIRRYFSY